MTMRVDAVFRRVRTCGWRPGAPTLAVAVLMIGTAIAVESRATDAASGLRANETVVIERSTLRALRTAKEPPRRTEAKMSSHIRRALRPAARSSAAATMLLAARPGWRTDSRMHVYVQVAATDPDTLGELSDRGLQIEIVNEELGIVQGWLEEVAVGKLADLAEVRRIQPIMKGRLRTGAVTTEGDATSRADEVLAQGLDGRGISVGVISDGIDSLAAARASGDLPPNVTVPADSRCGRGEGDEGTAMLEIVHDLAPGAGLMFAEGFSSRLAFIDAVNCLVDAGADVIVDDLGFFDEPFFEDGALADTVRQAVQAGVSYHSAAGNEGDAHVEQQFRASSGGFHNFSDSATDQALGLLVPGFTDVACILQWNDPFGGSSNDYDLFLLDRNLDPNDPIDLSDDIQDGTQDPLEFVSTTNTGSSPALVFIAIHKSDGAPRLLKMFCFGAAMEHLTEPGSIIGHPGVPEAIAVAAIDVNDPGLNDVEDFSSRGPTRIFFPSPETRDKPDVSAFDGVSITGAGGFPSPFFGTSAAAPHSAAVAALVLQSNPRLGPAAVKRAFQDGAVDIEATGRDNAAGYGRVDAVEAVAQAKCVTHTDCDDGDACTTESCNAGACAFFPVACDDGNACNGTETCNPATGCVAGAALTCDDGNACTTDSCNVVTGCAAPHAVGFAGADCELGRFVQESLCGGEVPTKNANAFAKRAKKARILISKANATSKLNKRRKLLNKARKLLINANKKIQKLGRQNKISASCAASVDQRVNESLGLFAALEAGA